MSRFENIALDGDLVDSWSPRGTATNSTSRTSAAATWSPRAIDADGRWGRASTLVNLTHAAGV